MDLSVVFINACDLWKLYGALYTYIYIYIFKGTKVDKSLPFNIIILF